MGRWQYFRCFYDEGHEDRFDLVDEAGGEAALDQRNEVRTLEDGC